jgi:DNA polymerase-3 subunit delta'
VSAPPVVIPSVLHHIVGQPDVVLQLAAAAAAPVHAYLFVGPAGSGKRAAARAFAAAMICADGGCGQCRDCRLALAGQHPDIREIERTGPAISVEQADEIVRSAALAPIESARKVLILDEFHLLRAEGAARLLKTIEEPPASTIFVVLADDVPPELVTVASRCVRIDFRVLADADVIAVLLAEGHDHDHAELAAHAAGGNLDRARLLVADPGLVARREAFQRLPRRLDGSGAAVVQAIDELVGLIEAAAAPLQDRQAVEVAALDARVEQAGERGSGRRTLEERHKREARRHRIDELRAGLAVLAATYRDELVSGSRDAAGAVTAVAIIHDAIEALDRNPNEALLLQDLFLRLPAR